MAIDGRPVRNLFDLTSLLDERNVGDAVEVGRPAAPQTWVLHSAVPGLALLSASFMLHRGSGSVDEGALAGSGSEAWQPV